MAELYDDEEYLRQLIEERRRQREALAQVEEPGFGRAGLALAGLAGGIGDALRGGGSTAQNISGMITEQDKSRRENRLKALSGSDDTIKSLMELNKSRRAEARQSEQAARQERLQAMRDEKAEQRLEKSLAASERRAQIMAGTKAGVLEDKAIAGLQKNLGNSQDLVRSIQNVEDKIGFQLEDYDQNRDDLPGVSLPGVGRVVAHSGPARELEGALSQVFNKTLRDRSGAAVTNPEMERLKREFNSGRFNSEPELINAAKQFKMATQQAMRDMELAARPTALTEYERRGGTTSGALNYRPGERERPGAGDSAIPQAVASERIKVSNGQETFVIDADDLESAMMEGFRQVQ